MVEMIYQLYYSLKYYDGKIYKILIINNNREREQTNLSI